MKRVILPLFLVILSVGYVVSNIQILKAERDQTSPAPMPLGLRRLSDFVIVVVLDGVPVRVAYDDSVMPYLVELSHEAARGVLRAPEETTTPAGVRALATGQSPSAADVLDMFRATEYHGWTVFDDVISRGETVSLGGDKAWTSLLASRDPAAVRVTDTETSLYQDARRVLDNAASRLESDKPPSLTVVHLSETDRIGHLYGTESPYYKKRMREIDDELREFVKRVVTPNATLLITADHGNDVYGSHGGEGDIYRNVPIITSGRGIRQGAGIKMDARALPGVLAVLLGTRVPAEMQAVIPVEAFALTDSDRATLVNANAVQLEHLAELRGVKLSASASKGLEGIEEFVKEGRPKDVVAAGPKILSSVVNTLDASSPLSAARVLWAAVLFCAVFLIGIEVLWPGGDLTVSHAIALWTVTGLLVLQMLLPRMVVPILLLILGVEVLFLSLRAIRPASRTGLAGAARAVGVMLLPAIRFAYMPQIKTLMQTAVLRLTVLSVTIAGFALFLVARRKHKLQFSRESETVLIALSLLAIMLLAPFATIPVLLIVATLLAIRAAGTTWIRVVWIAAALGAFFLLSQRLGFPRTGEDPVARYAYVLCTCAVVTTALLSQAGAQRGWLALAWVLLVPVWPFGYLKLAGPNPSPAYGAVLVVVPLATAAWLAARHIRSSWAYVPLVASLSYHLHATHAVFSIALGAHVAVLAAVAILPKSDFVRRSIVALTAMSALILMSPSAIAPSVLVIALGIFVVARIDVRHLSLSTVIIMAAVLLVFGRYAFVAVFSHGPSIDCTLKCVDEASGFLGFDETRWTWATVLVALKMSFASVLVISLVSSNSAFDADERRVLTVGLLLVCTFIAKAALHSALSFGPRGARLGISLSQAGYHTIVLLALVLGYVAYRLILNGGRTPNSSLPALSESAA